MHNAYLAIELVKSASDLRSLIGSLTTHPAFMGTGAGRLMDTLLGAQKGTSLGAKNTAQKLPVHAGIRLPPAWTPVVGTGAGAGALAGGVGSGALGGRPAAR